MERKQYLKLCSEISLIPKSVGGVLSRPPPELLVAYDGIAYYPFYYEMHFKNGEYYDIAVLHDLKANSLVNVPLEKVKEYKRRYWERKAEKEKGG